MNIPSSLHDKKILIAGLGVEGLSTLSFLHEKYPDISLSVADQTHENELAPEARELLKKTGASYYGGPNYLQALAQADVVMRSPGISPLLPAFQSFVKRGGLITSQTQIFLNTYHHQTIGITGTKGKSTTSSLIQHVLQEAGFTAPLLGNIGTPPFSYTGPIDNETFFVYELSSHQLQDVSRSPHIAVVLDIVPEHLDYYPSFDAYKEAKSPIVRYQTSDDIIVFNQQLPQPSSLAARSPGQQYRFSLDAERGVHCFVADQYIWYQQGETKEQIIALADLPLQGFFNLNNICPAIIIGRYLEIPKETIARAVAGFEPLPSRLENVGTVDGITFYDDSLATIPEATIGALKALGDGVETILVGGYERHQDFNLLAQEILAGGIKTVIVFPTTGQRIWDLVTKHNTGNKKLQCFPAQSMQEAVQLAFEHTSKGKICLLSSASPSFSLFKNYQEKSALYRRYIKECVPKT